MLGDIERLSKHKFWIIQIFLIYLWPSVTLAIILIWFDQKWSNINFQCLIEIFPQLLNDPLENQTLSLSKIIDFVHGEFISHFHKWKSFLHIPSKELILKCLKVFKLKSKWMPWELFLVSHKVYANHIQHEIKWLKDRFFISKWILQI